MQWGRVRVTGGFALLWALLLYFDTGIVVWFWAAAIIHELGHYIALMLAGGSVRRWEFTITGISMQTDTHKLHYAAEIIISLAGPALGIICAFIFSFLAGEFFGENGYALAGANLSLSLFNLLPAGALDGGRALWYAMCLGFSPEIAEKAEKAATILTAIFIAALGLVVFYRSGYNVTLLAVGIYLLGGLYVQKTGTPAGRSAQARTICGR